MSNLKGKFANKWRVATAISIAVIIVLSSFVVLYHPQAGVAAQPAFLNVAIDGPTKLNVNQVGTYAASVNNSYSGNLEYSWSISPSGDNKTVLLPFGSSCNLTFVEATVDRYVISVSVKDLVVGNLGQASMDVYDPYTSPNLYLGSTGASYSYLIETDGLGWYRAINGQTGAVAWSLTNAATVIYNAALATSNSGGGKVLLNGNITITSMIDLFAGSTLIHDVIFEGVICWLLRAASQTTPMFDLTSPDGVPHTNSNITFNNINFDGKGEYILHFHHTDGLTVTNCKLIYSVPTAAGQLAYGVGVSSDNLLIENCYFEGIPNSVFGDLSTDMTVRHCTISDATYGIQFTGNTNSRIENNIIMDSTTAISMEGGASGDEVGAVLRDNTIRDCTAAIVTWPTNGEVNNLLISGGSISGCTNGIGVSASTGGYVTGTTIKDVVFSDITTYCVTTGGYGVANIKGTTLSNLKTDDYSKLLNPALAVSWQTTKLNGATQYYPLNEAAGSSAFDYSRNVFTGTINGTASWVAGKYGSALDLDGLTNYILSDNNVLMNLTTQGTLMAWIKPDTVNTAQVILGKIDANTARYGYEIVKYQDQISLTVANASTADYAVSADGVITAGTWYFVCATWDGSFLQVYVNGLASGSAVAQTLTPTYQGGANGITVGKNPSSTNLYFDGSVDECAVLPYALSAQEIYMYYIGAANL